MSDYWRNRTHSGAGSTGALALFKADTVNRILAENDIRSVIEFGSGNGEQIALIDYPVYHGYDVNDTALRLCRERFADKNHWSFLPLHKYRGRQADMSVSLDVIFHLVNDYAYEQHMRYLFRAARKLVVVYSSNTNDSPTRDVPHIRHRRFTDWVEENTDWELSGHIKNPYPWSQTNRNGSFCDFWIFGKRG